MMKRNSITVASLFVSLFLLTSADASARVASKRNLAPAQCPFNVPVVNLPPESHPSGFKWGAAIRPLGDPCVESIIVDPSDEKTWYVSGNKGLYITRDGGLSWKHVLSGHILSEAVFLAPQNASEVYAGVGNKLLRSANKGVTWNLLHTFEQAVSSIFVAAGGRIYVGLAWSTSQTPNGIFISLNNGLTWKHSVFGGGQKGLICWDISRHSTSGALYVSTEIFNHPKPYHPPFFRSLDGGVTWQNVAGTLPWHVIAIEVRPADGYLYALTEGPGLYGSANQGNTWIAPSIMAGPSDSLLMDTKATKRLYGGQQKIGNSSGGAFVSVNAGSVFHPIGLKGVTVGGMSLNAGSTRLYAAAYGSGIHIATVPLSIILN